MASNQARIVDAIIVQGLDILLNNLAKSMVIHEFSISVCKIDNSYCGLMRWPHDKKDYAKYGVKVSIEDDVLLSEQRFRVWLKSKWASAAEELAAFFDKRGGYQDSSYIHHPLLMSRSDDL